MDINWIEFASIAVIHFFAVASPGPDFAVVLKQCMQRGRAAALWTSFGIGTGILLHVSYSLLGISLIIKATPWLFHLMLYLAAAYLLWMGVKAIQSAPSRADSVDASVVTTQSAIKSFLLGFVTNGINPKATLFFLSVFTVAIDISTSVYTKGLYGTYMALATALWFSFLSVVMSHSRVRKSYIANGYIFDRIMGAVLILMALFLLFNN